MKSIYFLFLFLGLGNLLHAQSVNSSLEFMKYAPQKTFSTKLELLKGEKQFTEPQNNIFKSGFFIDGILSFGIAFSDYNFNNNGPTPSIFVVYSNDIITDNSIRIGNKWYLDNGSKIKSGIQIIWVRFGQIRPLENRQGAFFPVTYRLSPLNIGLTNLIQLDEKKALELNLNVGFNTNIAYREPNAVDPNTLTLLQLGFLINPSIKLRIQRFSIGLDLQYMHAFPGTVFSSAGNRSLYNYDVNILLAGVTIGVKI